MATRSHTTFKKRQKELARLEKQRDKAAKRTQRKLEKSQSPEPGIDDDLLFLGPEIDSELDPEMASDKEPTGIASSSEHS